MYRFLFDECMSPELAGVARNRGYHALHVNWANLNARRDQHVALYAMGGDYVFVTNNGVDFRPIYRSFDIHPGLIIIVPSARRTKQIEMFEKVLERLEAEKDIINKLIEITGDGIITVSEFPPVHGNI